MVNLNLINNRKIALLGAGIETLALAQYFSRHNILCDLLEINENKVPQNLNYINKSYSGKDYLKNLSQYDLLIRSPGYPLEKIKNEAKEYNFTGEISSATKLFMQLVPCKVIGVTGTKGKGTTSTLIFEILHAAKRNVYLSGNIGKSPFEFLDNLNEDSLVVLELSSFQLEDWTISPSIAVMLEISPDHLKPLSQESPNFHKSIDDYVDAKSQIFIHQKSDDWAILNSDHKYFDKILNHVKSKKILISTNDKSADLYTHNDLLISPYFNNLEIDISHRKIIGVHNLENLLAASAVGLILKIDSKIIKDVLINFSGLPHRLQLVKQINKIKFFNDSYATNPEATIAAIKSFNKPISLILGGSKKGADFSELVNTIVKRKVKFIALIGEEAKRFETLFNQKNYKNYKNFNSDYISSIIAAKNNLNGDGIVLLSPACASKDMFKNAADRGEQFINIVENKFNGT